MQELMTNEVIDTKEKLIERVKKDYEEHDDELNSLHFDFNVKMRERDILDAYERLQWTINGDTLLRIGPNGRKVALFTDADTKIFEGNCKDFLKSLNGGSYLRKTAEEEIVDFIF